MSIIDVCLCGNEFFVEDYLRDIEGDPDEDDEDEDDFDEDEDD